MKKKRPAKSKETKRKPPKIKLKGAAPIKKELAFHNDYDLSKKQIQKLLEFTDNMGQRLDDMEIHVNLLTRLFTTICIEKFGMRVGVLKRLIKRIEEEAIRDSQIHHLEEIYQLSHPTKMKKPRKKKEDPWDDIA